MLWYADLATRAVDRRTTKGIGWARKVYSGQTAMGGPGIDSLLASEVENDAAPLLQAFGTVDPVPSSLPAQLGRYLAWAAARTISMRDLMVEWIGDTDSGEVAEPPPEGFDQIPLVARQHELIGPDGERATPADPAEVDALLQRGWSPNLSATDFSELVHLNAWYFQVRHFPRLSWVVATAPASSSGFVIGDRPVFWRVGARYDLPPSVLRHPEAMVYAPLTKWRALLGHHLLSPAPATITPAEVNRATAAAAHRWIAGPHRPTLEALLA
jgi:hypothetical protein